jgi:hypothetical protein
VLENLKTIENLEALTQDISRLLPTIAASVDTIGTDLESKLEEVKSSETKIRDYLNEAKNHFLKAQALLKSIGEQIQVQKDTQASLQTELQITASSLQLSVKTYLESQLQKSREDIRTDLRKEVAKIEPGGGVVQSVLRTLAHLIGSVVAGVAGGLVALASQKEIRRGDSSYVAYWDTLACANCF